MTYLINKKLNEVFHLAMKIYYSTTFSIRKFFKIIIAYLPPCDLKYFKKFETFAMFCKQIEII